MNFAGKHHKFKKKPAFLQFSSAIYTRRFFRLYLQQTNQHSCVRQKTTDRLIDIIDKYFDTLDSSLLVYKEGVRNYLYSNRKEFEDNLQAIKRVVGMSDKPLANE